MIRVFVILNAVCLQNKEGLTSTYYSEPFYIHDISTWFLFTANLQLWLKLKQKFNWTFFGGEESCYNNNRDSEWVSHCRITSLNQTFILCQAFQYIFRRWLFASSAPEATGRRRITPHSILQIIQDTLYRLYRLQYTDYTGAQAKAKGWGVELMRGNTLLLCHKHIRLYFQRIGPWPILS